jgi:hypothetical protein
MNDSESMMHGAILYPASCILHLLSVSCFLFRIFDLKNGFFGQALIIKLSQYIQTSRTKIGWIPLSDEKSMIKGGFHPAIASQMGIITQNLQ